MNVAGEDGVGIFEDSSRLICKDNFDLGTAFTDEIAVIFNVINAGEFVSIFTKKLAIAFESQHVGIGIYSCFVELVQADELVSNFVGGI